MTRTNETNTAEGVISRISILESGCWEYPNLPSRGGYVYVSIGGRAQPIHRIVYEYVMGEIPKGYLLVQSCLNKKCANPEHIELTPKKGAKNTIDSVLLRLVICEPTVLDTGCWEWTGCLSGGYGRVHMGGCQSVHVVVYEYFRGKVPEGLTLDHLCRNRKCANPYHLEPTTRGENVLRGIGVSAENAKKTHCPKGHEYSEENTYIRPKGGRVCRICAKLSHRFSYLRKKENSNGKQNGECCDDKGL